MTGASLAPQPSPTFCHADPIAKHGINRWGLLVQVTDRSFFSKDIGWGSHPGSGSRPEGNVGRITLLAPVPPVFREMGRRSFPPVPDSVEFVTGADELPGILGQPIGIPAPFAHPGK